MGAWVRYIWIPNSDTRKVKKIAETPLSKYLTPKVVVCRLLLLRPLKNEPLARYHLTHYLQDSAKRRRLNNATLI